jgi:hypothetical protein
LPDEKRVVVAELGDVTSRIQVDRAYETRLGVANQMAFQEAQDLAAEWFNPEAVKSRLNYRSLAEDRKPETKPSTAS